MWIRLSAIANADDVMPALVAARVVVVPGRAFAADADAPCPYFRLSYASCSEEQLRDGFQRLRAVLLACTSSN